ncbi:Synerg-CTERM sorting domain-containing protein [Aminomonas paucivorans]|uniref:Synerg-CTERM sorting domain-containing protein n=1 Tax=Aminomonas paucivorans TaxID=81412 RepID=UPI0012EAA80C|nr:Synerg-CTERM sorting domain-containing protein [Aminomonas paucivorans]
MAATPTPTSTPTGTPTPVVSPVPTLAPTLTPAPTVAPRATETPLPTETPVASPTGTLQPTPGTSLIPTVGLIGETLSGITNGAVYSLGSDPLASQRAAEFRNLILGTGTTSGTRASQVRASSFGYQARDLIQRFMGVPVNRYTANIAVTPVNLLQGDGSTLYADLTFRRSAADAAARSEIFLVLPTYEAGASGTRTMTGFVLLTPHSTASATERTFHFDVVDNAVRDRNGVTGKVEAEYYVVRVAANPGQLVSATPTERYRSSGCSAFGYGPLALLLLAPLSLLKRRR